MLTIGHPFTLLSSVQSTSNYIADHPQLADMSEGTAIMTYHQTHGRGQRQRNWEMVEGEDLAVSYLLRPRIAVAQAFLFNKLIAIALRNCISDYVSGEVSIKWPNDIFIEGKKVAGILVEPTWQGENCRHMVVGIGINVNSNLDRSQYNATSIFHAGGLLHDLMEVFRSLNRRMTDQYERLGVEPIEVIHLEYDKHLLGYNQSVVLQEERNVTLALLLGVDDIGRLRVSAAGVERALQHGSVHVDYSGTIGQ